MPAVTRPSDTPPTAVTRPDASRRMRSGFSSATRGVTARTVASSGRRRAASTKCSTAWRSSESNPPSAAASMEWIR